MKRKETADRWTTEVEEGRARKGKWEERGGKRGGGRREEGEGGGEE